MATESYAQTFGVKGGLNLANWLVKDDVDTYSDDFKMALGLNLGVTAEFPINDMLSFETGLMFNTKGFAMKESMDFFGETMEIKSKTTLNYIDIPLTVKATFAAGSSNIFALAGPYVGIGLSGKTKATVTYGGESETDTEDMEFGSEDDQMKRLDYGLIIGAGVDFGTISVGASYGLGLGNLVNNPEDGSKVNNRVISISVGYKF
jgi:outer membrane protein W